MEYYLSVSTDFTITIKPTHIFIRVIQGEPAPGFINVYWRLISSNRREDGSISLVSTVVEGNQMVPNIALVALLSGDTDTLNMILGQMAWGGPLEGFVLQVDGKVTEDDVYRGIEIKINDEAQPNNEEESSDPISSPTGD